VSDNFLRLIPTDPDYLPTFDARASAIEKLRLWLPAADEITATATADVEFVDQGGNFERVLCPSCGTELALQDWHDAMDRAAGTAFRDLSMVTPCCGAATSLNDLIYEWPAGFARFVLEAMNPNARDLTERQHRELEEVLGTPLRRIWSHI
jgi:hypothetical protein